MHQTEELQKRVIKCVWVDDLINK